MTSFLTLHTLCLFIAILLNNQCEPNNKLFTILALIVPEAYLAIYLLRAIGWLNLGPLCSINNNNPAATVQKPSH